MSYKSGVISCIPGLPYHVPGFTGEAWVFPNEIHTLQCLAVKKDYAEIGTFHGYSAWEVAKVATSVICIDHFRGIGIQSDQIARLNLNGRKNVTIYNGTDDAMCAQLLNNSLDVLFLDADHTERGTYNTLKLYYEKVRPHGNICLHDYSDHPILIGVKTAAHKFFNRRPDLVINMLAVYQL